MRRRMLGLMMAVGLLMGVPAAPAAAQGPAEGSPGKGCPNIGVEWSIWGQHLNPEDPPIGPTTAELATAHPAGYAHIIAAYC